jgi:hypothetical protein
VQLTTAHRPTGAGLLRLRQRRAMEDEVSCVRCGLRIAPRKDFVFRIDGRIEHVKCPVPAPAPDPICPACSKPIRPVDSVAKNGEQIVHIRCLTPRPIAEVPGP